MKKSITPYYIFIFFICFTPFFFLSSQPLLGAENSTGIQIMEKEVLGKYLADSSGITLYAFKKDEKNKSNCIEGCAVNWPPFNLDPSAALAGCDPFESEDFATITRSDGLPQTTYKGMPLYYFKNDKYPGDTFGNGIGNAWFLVIP
jgi:predicted lipoprotein with Yx(FWY)xxD motif